MQKTKPYDIVVVSGGFDPLHKGHVRLFNEGKRLGHKLICGLNSDPWVVKKNGRVNLNFGERSEIISSFRAVDEVISFNDSDDSAINLLTRIQSLYPECSICFANGGQMEEKNTPESGFCKAYGIDMLWNVGGDSPQQIVKKQKTKTP
jgi:cytidyltransferase-like protein